MSDECKHGSLRRSCEICERDVEIERLRAELATANKRIEELTRDLHIAEEELYYPKKEVSDAD